VNDSFSDDHFDTIGADFDSKLIEIGEEKVKLQVWDTVYYRPQIGCF